MPSWADGTATNFGLLVAGESSSVDERKNTCGNHPDCKGFNYKISNGRCSFWKTGNTGSIHPTASTDYNCYEKLHYLEAGIITNIRHPCI